jgi:dUTP pyrophosphatase
MKVKRLHEHARLPEKAHPGDLGYDLFSVGDTLILPSRTVLIPTGIAVQFPEGYGGMIRDRSSVATKQSLFTVAGIIDNGYVGEIRVALYNASNELREIRHGEKIAQMILQPVVTVDIEEVITVASVDGRGTNGFGSTNER